MKNHFLFCIITLSVMHAIQPISFKKAFPFFGKDITEEIINKQFQATQHTVASIENLYGNIHIKTEWNQNSIVLSATHKKNTEKEGDLTIADEQITDKQLSIKTVALTEKPNDTIDMTFIVPNNLQLNLSTKDGNITIEDGATGIITALTQNGTISLTNIHAPVTATAEQSGSIKIQRAYNSIKTKTESGQITIADSQKTIIAESKKGNISISCNELSTAEKMWIKTDSGRVTLDLPEDINANLFAQTERGIVTCDIPVTLKPLTTTLDKVHWKKVKREVDGTLGTGEAEIKVVSHSNSIKIRKLVT